MIVLADQNRRQIPKRGNIQGLEQLSLIRRTITVQRERHRPVLGVLLREGQATTQRHLSPDDAVTAVKPSLLLVEVHRASLSFGAPGLSSHKLREDLEKGPAAAEERAVVAVSSDDAILLCDRGLHAHGHGFLAVVEVAEPADQLSLVERVRCNLHAPHRRHVAEEGEELLRVGVYGARRRLALVRGEGNGGLDSEGSAVIGGSGGDRTAERWGAR